MTYAAVSHGDRAWAAARRRRLRRGFTIAAAAIPTALIVGLLALGWHLTALAVLVVPAGFAVLCWRPALGFYAVYGGALLFDHNQLRAGVLTGRVPFWETFGGLPPPALLLTAALAIQAVVALHRGEWPPLRFGPLFPPVLAFSFVIVYGVLRGLTFDDLRYPVPFRPTMALIEVGSLIYLPVAYVAAHTFIRTAAQLRALLWVTIVALALVAFALCWLVVTLGMGVFSFNEIASHEASLFLNMLILLCVGLWFYRGDRAARWTVTGLMPFVLVALVANQRRLGFIVLALGLIICGVLLLADPRHRRRVLLLGGAGLLLALVYGAAFWNSSAPVAQPVYAFRSIFQSEQSDASVSDLQSNSWRGLEKINIDHTVRSAPLLGIGFGRQYMFWVEQPSLDPTGFTYWRYVTHNAMYWLWMKLGALGFAVFWWLIGAAVILGVQVFRRLPPGELKVLPLMIVGFIAMQVVFMYADLALGSGRNMVVLGAFLGVLASLDRLEDDANRKDAKDAKV